MRIYILKNGDDIGSVSIKGTTFKDKDVQKLWRSDTNIGYLTKRTHKQVNGVIIDGGIQAVYPRDFKLFTSFFIHKLNYFDDDNKYSMDIRGK